MKQQRSPWKTLSSTVVHKNNFFEVEENQVIRPNKTRGTYHVVLSRDAVFSVPINEKQQIGLVYMYRYTNKSWGWELPAGGGEGKNLLVMAKKELAEEAFLQAKQWKRIGSFYSANGLFKEKAVVYVAHDLHPMEQTSSQLDEGITQFKFFSANQIKKMIQSGAINCGQTQAALLQTFLYLKNFKIDLRAVNF